MREKWKRVMLRLHVDEDKEPRLSEIINFLNEKTLLASGLPLYCEAQVCIAIPSEKKSIGEEDFRAMLH